MSLKLNREELAALRAMLEGPGFQVFQRILTEECKGIDIFQVPFDTSSTIQRERDLGRLEAFQKISSIINSTLELNNG